MSKQEVEFQVTDGKESATLQEVGDFIVWCLGRDNVTVKVVATAARRTESDVGLHTPQP